MAFRGPVISLTADQAVGRPGRRPEGPDLEYRVTGFVPPHTADDGLASFWLSEFQPGAWCSRASVT
jgi:hypothetical protein